jgi:hypothetical protein
MQALGYQGNYADPIFIRIIQHSWPLPCASKFQLHMIGCVVVVDVFRAYRMHVVSLSFCLLSQAALGLNPIAGERVVLSVRVDGGPAHVLGTLARGKWPPTKGAQSLSLFGLGRLSLPSPQTITGIPQTRQGIRIVLVLVQWPLRQNQILRVGQSGRNRRRFLPAFYLGAVACISVR